MISGFDGRLAYYVWMSYGALAIAIVAELLVLAAAAAAP